MAMQLKETILWTYPMPKITFTSILSYFSWDEFLYLAVFLVLKNQGYLRAVIE